MTIGIDILTVDQFFINISEKKKSNYRQTRLNLSDVNFYYFNYRDKIQISIKGNIKI